MQSDHTPHTTDAQPFDRDFSQLEAALWWARLGVPVFPVWGVKLRYDVPPEENMYQCRCAKGLDCGRDSGKHPMVSGGPHAATIDEEQIQTWWSQWPNANIGAATGGGLYVVDVDGPEGEASVRDLAERGRELPPTMGSTTGNGRHLYYVMPPTHDLDEGGKYVRWKAGNTQGRLGDHIDTRGAGGYVVLPPSLHLSGTRYQYIDADPVDLPEWVIATTTSDGPTLVPPPGPDGEETTPMDDAARVNDPRAARRLRRALPASIDRILNAGSGQRHAACRDAARYLAGWYALQNEITSVRVLDALRDAASKAYADAVDRIPKAHAAIEAGWRDGLTHPHDDGPQWTHEDRPRPYLVGHYGHAGYWVATGDGYEFALKAQVLSALEIEWPDLDLWVPKSDGRGFKQLSPDQVFERHGRVYCRETRCNYVEGNYFHAGVLHRRTWSPPPWAPTYHERVQEWLDVLFDGDTRPLDWLATLAQLDYATAFLLLTGPDSVGKGMLAKAIAEFYGVAPMSYEDSVGRFNAGLAYCPFIVLDEGTESGTHSVPLRRFANDAHRIEQKNSPQQTLTGYPRLLATANEADVFQLTDASMSPRSARALGRRILETEVPDRARSWLASKGGRSYTEGWPTHDIPEHIAWLHANRDVVHGDRFVVEGDAERYLATLGTRRGIPASVIELLGMLADGWPDNHKERTASSAGGAVVGQAVHWRAEDPDHVYVNVRGLSEAWRARLGEAAPSHMKLTDSLRLLSRFPKTVRVGSGGPRCWPVPLDRIPQD